jgi:hypothetical protein
MVESLEFYVVTDLRYVTSFSMALILALGELRLFQTTPLLHGETGGFL